MNVIQYIVTLMNLNGIFERRVNCANEECARFIAHGIYGKVARVIDVKRA